MKRKLNLDFLFLYQEPIIKGGGGIKDKKKFKPQVTHFPFTGFAFLCETDSLRGAGVLKGRGRELRRSFLPREPKFPIPIPLLTPDTQAMRQTAGC